MATSTYVSGILFTKAYKLVRARTQRILVGYELNPTYWSILSAAITAKEGIRLAAVANLLGVKAPMVTMMVDDLSARGLMERLPHHTDKRVKLLIATPRGKRLAKKIEAELNNEIEILLAGLTEADVTTFGKVLETIIANSAS